MEYDVFISHASEDKKEFVEPLAITLQKAGLKVWYDNFELKLGDSLREKIDYGLANSRYGVVVLSKAFFGKQWPQTELDALVSRQNTEGKKVILPIWHEVGVEDVKRYSPILASKLAARSSDGIDAITSQIMDVCRTNLVKSQSVFQAGTTFGLREQCLELIRNDNLIEWRKLLQANADSIPDQLVRWKQEKGDAASHKGGKDWEDALLDAARICLPGFIPIFAALESGNQNYWLEAMGFVRRLAILENKMGGGSVWAINVPNYMLYVVGSLGISIAASLKLLDMIEQWMSLRIQSERRGQEMPWIDCRRAFYGPEGLPFNHRDPFSFLLKIVALDELKGFFGNRDRTEKNLFAANLICSLIELRLCAQDTDCRTALQKNDEILHFAVLPLWCLMKSEMFQETTLDCFRDSEGVRRFIFPQRSALSVHMWDLWKTWRVKCTAVWSGSSFFWRDTMWFTLPGEPPDKS